MVPWFVRSYILLWFPPISCLLPVPSGYRDVNWSVLTCLLRYDLLKHLNPWAKTNLSSLRFLPFGHSDKELMQSHKKDKMVVFESTSNDRYPQMGIKLLHNVKNQIQVSTGVREHWQSHTCIKPFAITGKLSILSSFLPPIPILDDVLGTMTENNLERSVSIKNSKHNLF